MKKHFLISVLFITSVFSSFAEVYKKEATVSFYAEDFHGKKTSNGEIFNMNALTCANKSLPFDTKLKVTNLSNGKSVIVRVNDRGPFVADRELDLSKAAAIKLDMVKQGVAKVKIEIVEMGPDTKISRDTAARAMEIVNRKKTAAADLTQKTQPKAAAVKSTTYDAAKYYDIQLGSFKTRENAEKRAREIKKAGFTNIVLQSNSEIIRVAIGKIPGNKVPALEKELKAKGFTDYLVKERKK